LTSGNATPWRAGTVEPGVLQGDVGRLAVLLEHPVLLLEVEQRPRGDRHHQLAFHRIRHAPAIMRLIHRNISYDLYYVLTNALDMITSGQLRAARALVGIDQRTLAKAARLSLPTIQRMEASDGVVRGNVESLMKLIAAPRAPRHRADQRGRGERRRRAAASA
jgi:hypothetical protein